jgi:uncharacterized protein with ATP-grasp and redox domains
MNTDLDCIPCLLRQSLEAARRATEDRRIHEQVMREVLGMVAELDLHLPPPFVSQAVNRRLRQMTGVADPYRAAKTITNRLAVEALPGLANSVRQAPDPLLAAARYAIAANALDMGAVANLTEVDARRFLSTSIQGQVQGDLEGFRRAAIGARRILYLADNAGEIAVDRLLIEALGPDRVTLAVRGAPVLNDATLADAAEVGMDKLVEVVDNGSDAPGTILADCSGAFRRRFEEADLVVAKGQGNFETLSDAGPGIAFLFKVKCPVVAGHVGLAVGSHALVCVDGRSSSRPSVPARDLP